MAKKKATTEAEKIKVEEVVEAEEVEKVETTEDTVENEEVVENEVTEDTEEETTEAEKIVEEEKEKEVLPVITLDNQPVSPIVVENDEEEIPNNFVDVKPVINTKAKHNIYNGRVYKVLNNGRGMFADNGETFDLSIIK